MINLVLNIHHSHVLQYQQNVHQSLDRNRLRSQCYVESEFLKSRSWQIYLAYKMFGSYFAYTWKTIIINRPGVAGAVLQTAS